MEQGIRTVRNQLRSTAETMFRGEGVLGEVALLILKNQYFIYVTNKINAAADACRSSRIPRSVLSDSIVKEKFNKMENCKEITILLFECKDITILL